MAGSAAAPTADNVPSADAPAERIDPRRFAAFVFMVFGMFMSILDIQIVSASLSEIQAGLSASADEISWVQTAYLIAEVIAIPFSGFMSRALGTRYLFAISAGGFTVASLMCGLSGSIGQIIIWRALQGFIGAGMIPTVFASAYTIFPRSKAHIVSPIIGLVATLAPTIGPTVGGYLTDALSWHWLFFINIVPGIAVTVGALTLIDFDKPHLELLDRLDWIGFFSMAGFLGSLEYVLEEGPRNDWLEEPLILIFTIVSLLSGIVFLFRVFTATEPIVNLRAFKDRNFALGNIFAFAIGIGLYGLTYLYPIYLAQVRGYNALMIGETMFVTGVTQFVTAPLIGASLRLVDSRKLLCLGMILFAVGTWQMTWITRDYDFWELLIPQILRGAGLMLAIIPSNNIALGTLPPELLKNASGLFNLTRNLGGAVGLAVINTVLNMRTDLHIARLHDAVTWGNAAAVSLLDDLTRRFQGVGDAQLMALKQLNGIVHRQAVVMSFGDVFMVLTLAYLAMSVLTLLVRRVNLGPAAAGE